MLDDRREGLHFNLLRLRASLWFSGCRQNAWWPWKA